MLSGTEGGSTTQGGWKREGQGTVPKSGLSLFLARAATRAGFMNATNNRRQSADDVPFRDMLQLYDTDGTRQSKQNTFAVPSVSGVGSLDYGQPPRRIPHLWKTGLSMLAGQRQASHQQWMSGSGAGGPSLYLPIVRFSSRGRGPRQISKSQGKFGFNPMDYAHVPAVFVPTVTH